MGLCTTFPLNSRACSNLKYKERKCEDVCLKFMLSDKMGHIRARFSQWGSFPSLWVVSLQICQTPAFFAETVTSLTSLLDLASRTPVHSKLGPNPSFCRCTAHYTIKATKPRLCRAREITMCMRTLRQHTGQGEYVRTGQPFRKARTLSWQGNKCWELQKHHTLFSCVNTF